VLEDSNIVCNVCAGRKLLRSLCTSVFVSRFTGGACGHEGKLIVLIIALLWKGDQPIDL
jgi:hypothetical protein